MEKENKFDLNSEKKKELENKFHKTLFGKFMKLIIVITFILIFISIFTTIFRGVLYFGNFDISKYQNILDIGSICWDYTGSFSILTLLIYTVCLPILMNEKEYNSNTENTGLEKFIKTSTFKVIISILLFLNIINLVYEIGYIIGKMIAT